ncbi:MAG: epoxyqueuosine reductase QueH [Elusimicrobia bacterium]|nr:epoxyqueuosine reductase QueH [Elusimicrobiota bacterium]
MTSKKLLLHICCAPCACYSVDILRADAYDITGYWFNPNIHGFREYSKRLMALGYYASKISMSIIEDNYSSSEWFRDTADHEGKDRCRACYSMRINAVAERAASEGFDGFSSTLFYSKHQSHNIMKEIAEEAGIKHGLEFVYRDFRQGWKEGIRMSRELGLYRQQYCGCVFSEIERFHVSKKS